MAVISDLASGSERTNLQNQSNILSVSDALRHNDGRITVKGMIVTLSAPYKMISSTRYVCKSCKMEETITHNPPLTNPDHGRTDCSCGDNAYPAEIEFVNAISIQLQDDLPKNDLEKLDVILYDEDSKNVIPGENVTINGRIHIQSSRGHRLTAVLHADIVKHASRETIKLSQSDIQSFKRFAALPNCDKRLVSMFAPNVIGHEDKKLGLLLSLVGAYESDNRRGRINTLLVGPPGNAKSTLAREATKLLTNSRYVTAQNASGKSLTAIIEKEGDNSVLRLGAIPLAKEAICAINEIGSMSFQDQHHLLDVLEEGHFTIDKYGIHREIHSPTTIIATANPYGTDWADIGKISKDEIPLRKELLDRFDQIFSFRNTSAEEDKEYVRIKTELYEKPAHNYTFLKKYVLFARSINPQFTPAAKDMLNQFWLDIKSQGLGNNRTWEGIYRVAQAYARLNLKDVVDEEIAAQSIEFFRTMLLQYGKVVSAASDPRSIVIHEVIDVIKSNQSPTEFVAAARTASGKNERVRMYIGNRWSLSGNKKLREISEIIRDHEGIIVNQVKPLVLSWAHES